MFFLLCVLVMVPIVLTKLQISAKMLQIQLPEEVGPPWLQSKCNMSIPQP